MFPRSVRDTRILPIDPAAILARSHLRGESFGRFRIRSRSSNVPNETKSDYTECDMTFIPIRVRN